MYKKFSDEVKDRGYKALLEEHNNSVEAVISYAKGKGYYSQNSKIAYLKNELKRVKNQEVSKTNYYKDNLYLLTEIRTKINQVESKFVTIPTIVC